MRRKIIVMSMLILTSVTMLTGCGNMSLGLGNYTYRKVHVNTYHDSECFTINKWYDNERGIEVNTKEIGSMFLSEGTYLLIEDECPFCDNK